MSSDRPFDPNHKAFGCVVPHPEQVKRHRSVPETVTLYDGKRWEELSNQDKIQYARGSVPQEQLFYVKLILTQANATSSQFREFEDVVSVKYEDHWLRIFDKTGDWTFPRERVIEVQTTRQP